MSNTSNQVLFYSTEIFAAAGVQYSEVATVIVGVTLLGFTIVTVSIDCKSFLYLLMDCVTGSATKHVHTVIPGRDSWKTDSHALRTWRNGCLLHTTN